MVTLLLACARVPPDSSSLLPSDAASPLDLELAIDGPTDIQVVRGDSVDVPFVIAGLGSATVSSVGAIGLPVGVTCDPAMDASRNGSVTLHASADAASIETTVELLIADTGAMAAFHLSVVGFDGSLDPTFGKAGTLRLPLPAPGPDVVGIAPSGARMVIAGTVHEAYAVRDVWVARLLEDGSWDTTFGEGGAVTVAADENGNGFTADALAACDDETIAVAATKDIGGGTNESITEHLLSFDAGGNREGDVTLPFAVEAAACAGGSFFGVGGIEDLVVVDPAESVTTLLLPVPTVGAHVVAAPALVDVGARPLVQLRESSGAWSVDASFADQGVLTGDASAALVRDASSRLLLASIDAKANVLQLRRVLPDGTADVFGTNGVFVAALGSMSASSVALALSPSGDAFVALDDPEAAVVTLLRVDGSGDAVTTFGDDGRVTTSSQFVADTTLAGAAFDADGGLWVALSNGTLFRYRIASP